MDKVLSIGVLSPQNPKTLEAVEKLKVFLEEEAHEVKFFSEADIIENVLLEFKFDVIIIDVRASEIAADRVEDARAHLNVGDTVEAKFIGLDKKNRMINLSIKAKDELDTAYDASSLDNQGGDAPKLGDILKEKMGSSAQDDEK